MNIRAAKKWANKNFYGHISNFSYIRKKKMKQLIRTSFLACFLIASMSVVLLAQSKENAIQEIVAFQKKQNEHFSNPLQSPLTEAGLANFDSLHFFPIQLKYRVEAKFVRTPNEKPFRMRTTTERTPEYVKYGEAHFKIDGVDCVLSIYQNVDLIKKEGYKDYLFVPYKDATSGEESYGGGKYIDLRTPKGTNTLILDFNQAYNPYCAYNHKYSCPIPPSKNTLEVAIPAGVKTYVEAP